MAEAVADGSGTRVLVAVPLAAGVRVPVAAAVPELVPVAAAVPELEPVADDDGVAV